MVRTLNVKSEVPCSILGRDLCCVFALARHFTLIASFSTQGWVVQKPFSANPGFDFNRSIYSSCIKMFFTPYSLCSSRSFQLGTEEQLKHRKPYRKVTKLKSKFSLILG